MELKETIRLFAEFTDSDGDPVDVYDVVFKVYTNGELYQEIPENELIKESDGIYYYDFILPQGINKLFTLVATAYLGGKPQSSFSIFKDLRPIYSSVTQVINYTGIRPEDLGLETSCELEVIIHGWLVDIKNFIDEDRNRDYYIENKIPSGINNITLRICANMIAQSQLRRDTPLVKIDDFNIQMVEDKIFTEAIRRDLSRFPAKPRFRMLRVGVEKEGEE